MRLITFLFVVHASACLSLAQTKQVLKTPSTNALTESLVVPTGKSITIDAGATITNNGTATGFGGGGGGLTNIASTVTGGTLTLAGTLTTGRTITARDLAGTLALTSDLSAYLTTATAASTYEPILTAGTTSQYYRGDKSWQTLNATAVGLGNVSNALQLVAANNLSDLTNTTTARSNLGLGTLATQNGSFTTGGNGDADAGKVPLLTAHGGLNLGANDVVDGNIITVRTGYGYGIAVGVAGNGQGIYSELNDSFSQAFHAHVTSSSTGSQTGYDADLTGGAGINYGFAIHCNPTHFPFYMRERNISTGVGHDRYTIDAQGEHTWYADGTTLTTGTNKTSLLIETPSGTGAYTLKAGRTGDLVSTGDTGTVTNTMLAGSIAASKLVGTDIATLGTITSGTWQGSIIAPAYLGTGSSITTKYLRGDGTWQTIAGGGDALTTNPLSQFASTTSSQFAGVISDETGTGAVVLASSPALTTPSLGTPSSVTLTNATGLPLSTGVTGTLPIANGGTGQTTATAAFDALSPNTTKGDITVHNGTNNVRLAGGTDGHVLTRDSTAASGVKWAAASGGGSGGNWVLISTTTISGSPSTLDFTFSGSYRRYRLELENVYGGLDGYQICMRTSTDGGSTFDSGASNYGYAYGSSVIWQPYSGTGTEMITTAYFTGSASDEGTWGEIEFFDPLNAALKSFCKWELFGRIYNNAAPNIFHGTGYRDSAADVDTVRLFMSSGSFAGGKIRLFGWSE